MFQKIFIPITAGFFAGAVVATVLHGSKGSPASAAVTTAPAPPDEMAMLKAEVERLDPGRS